MLLISSSHNLPVFSLYHQILVGNYIKYLRKILLFGMEFCKLCFYRELYFTPQEGRTGLGSQELFVKEPVFINLKINNWWLSE